MKVGWTTSTGTPSWSRSIRQSANFPLLAVLSAALFWVAASAGPAWAVSDCGGIGQRACGLQQIRPCGPGLERRGGRCERPRTIPGQSLCGRPGRPACPREKRYPVCAPGTVERGGKCVPRPRPCIDQSDPRCRPRYTQ